MGRTPGLIAPCIRSMRLSHWTARLCRAALQPITSVGRSFAYPAGGSGGCFSAAVESSCIRPSALAMQEPLLRAEGLDYDTFPEAPASPGERARAG